MSTIFVPLPSEHDTHADMVLPDGVRWCIPCGEPVEREFEEVDSDE